MFGNPLQCLPLSFNRLLRIAFFTAVFTVLFGLLLVYHHEPTRAWITTGVNYIGYGSEQEGLDLAMITPFNFEGPSPSAYPSGVVEEEDVVPKSEPEPQSLLEEDIPPSTSAPLRPPVAFMRFRATEPSSRTIQLRQRFKKVHQSFWSSIKKTVGCRSKYLKLTGGKSKWDDGGKWTCGLKEIGNTVSACDPVKPCALFSFGVKGNSFFEAEVLQKTCCNVFAYDPEDTKIGRPISPTNPRVKFHELAVGKEDINNTKKFKTLMEENGYDWVDVVKMDIEGWEYEVLQSIFEDFEEIPIGMLLVEFHSEQPKRILDTFDKLEVKGMRIFHAEINPYFPDYACEYSLINVNAGYDFLAELINLDD